jgi:hypothetical protein
LLLDQNICLIAAERIGITTYSINSFDNSSDEANCALNAIQTPFGNTLKT